MRPFKLCLIILSVVLFLFGSCNQTPRNTNNTITIQLAAEPNSLSPFWGGDAARNLLLHYTTHGLTMINPADGQTIPVLIEQLPKVSPDGKKYELSLHPEVKWPDGVAVTSEDVLFSMKAAIATDNPRSAVRVLFGSVNEISASDDRTLSFSFAEKDITNESLFSGIPIVDRRIYDPGSLLASYSMEDLLSYAQDKQGIDSTNSKDLIAWNTFLENENLGQSSKSTRGTLGPYKLVKWEANSHIMLCPTEGFWASGKTEPWYSQNADTLLFRFVSEATALRLQIRQQAFDLALQIPGVAFNDSLKTPDYNYEGYNGSVYTFLAFNTRKNTGKVDVLGRSELRKAVSHLIPVDDIIEDFYQGRGVQVLSPIPPGKPSYNRELVAEKYDPSQATGLLDAAGYSDVDGDLIREFEANGKKEDVSFELLYPSGVPPAEATALRLRDEARKIGIEIKAEPIAFRELFGRVMSLNYEAALLASSIGPYPYDYAQDFQTGSQVNHTGFSNVKIDSLVELANRSLDPETRNKIMWEIQSVIHDEKPVIYLFNTTQPVAIHKRMKDVKIMPFSPYVWCNSLKK